MGNIHAIVLLPEDCDVTDPTCITHRKSMDLLEGMMINFSSSDAHCAMLPMTELCSFCFFNCDLNHHSAPIKQ